MKQTAPLTSGGMNALRLPAFSENLLPADDGSFGHKDSPKSGEILHGQGEEAWKQPKAGQSLTISLQREELGTAIRHYMFHCRALAVTVQSLTSALRPLTF